MEKNKKYFVVDEKEKIIFKRYVLDEDEKLIFTLGKEFDNTASVWGDSIDYVDLEVFNQVYVHVCCYNEKGMVASFWNVTKMETVNKYDLGYREEIDLYDNARI